MYEEIASNKRKSVLLVIGAFLFLGAIGLAIGYLFGTGPLGLVIALVLRARSGGRVRRLEVVWGAVLAASLGAFLVVAGVAQHGVGAADVRTAAVMAGCGLLLAGSCVVVARQRRGRTGSAAALGVAVGVINASTAAMLKALTTTAHRGLDAVLGSWQLYVLAVLVAAALFLNQMAFQAGPLSASLPVISSVDPLASVVIGVFVLDETVRHGPSAVVALVVLLGALGAAVIALSRSSAQVPAPAAS